MSMATPEAQREFQRNWLAARRSAWFSGKVCVSCGTTENLQLHHKDRKMKVSHNVWSWRQERRDTELAKCEVRCADCHRSFHSEHNDYCNPTPIENRNFKWTPEQVKQIRVLAEQRIPSRKIAKIVDIPRSTVYNIIERKIWAWVN
jgi:transposase-like protein